MNTTLWVMWLAVALLGVAVVTHYQTAIAVRETNPFVMRPAAALHVDGDFSRMTVPLDIAATADALEMVP